MYLSHCFLCFDLHFFGCFSTSRLPATSFLRSKLNRLLSIGLFRFKWNIHLSMCLGNILLGNILPHGRNKMIKSFFSSLCHAIICTQVRRRQRFSWRWLRESRDVSRCRTIGQKGMPSSSLSIIYFHSIIQFNIPLKSYNKSRMLSFFLWSRGIVGGGCIWFSLCFRFSSIDFDDGVFDHRKKFSFLILFSFSCFFFTSSFFMEDFRHGSFVVELICLVSCSFHPSFQTKDKMFIDHISNLLKLLR